MHILESLVRNLLRIWVLTWINLKVGTKSKIPRKRIEQIEQHVKEIDDNAKQFAKKLNKLSTIEDNQENIMLQDIINKNEIASDNSIKLIETSLTEIGVEAST